MRSGIRCLLQKSHRSFSSLESSMVDVSSKAPTKRTAIAQCNISMNEEAFSLLKAGSLAKGDAVKLAEVAGIMGAKQTSSLIPLCH